MLAHVVRFAVGLLAAVLAVFAYLTLAGWAWWIVPFIIFIIGSAIAEWLFRKLATPKMIRADLEDRVRNPPP
jgi:fatty acid desaturase